jgi:phospholipid transport system substrate-binding protein
MFPVIARFAADAAKSASWIAASAVISVAGTAYAQDTPPDLLVKNVTLEVVDIVRGDKDIQAGDRRKVVAVIEAKILPHFNFNAMTASAMARPLRAKPTDTDVTVTVRVMQSGAQPVQLEYDMEKRPNGWKVWDVRVAGISLVANYRSEFDNQVRDGGIDGLIKTLRSKNQSLDRPAVAAGGDGKK